MSNSPVFRYSNRGKYVKVDEWPFPLYLSTDEIEWKLNYRPRKSLSYRTLLEYYKQFINFDF